MTESRSDYIHSGDISRLLATGVSLSSVRYHMLPIFFLTQNLSRKITTIRFMTVFEAVLAEISTITYLRRLQGRIKAAARCTRLFEFEKIKETRRVQEFDSFQNAPACSRLHLAASWQAVQCRTAEFVQANGEHRLDISPRLSAERGGQGCLIEIHRPAQVAAFLITGRRADATGRCLQFPAESAEGTVYFVARHC